MNLLLPNSNANARAKAHRVPEGGMMQLLTKWNGTEGERNAKW
jgi:hypothetical protein